MGHLPVMRTYYNITAIKHGAITGRLMEQKRGLETVVSMETTDEREGTTTQWRKA